MNINESITDKIKSEQIKMLPKSYFIWQNTLNVLFIVGLFLIAIFILSFLLFQASVSGLLWLPVFGLHGVLDFFVSFPWFMIFLVAVILIGTEYLMGKYPIIYQRPRSYSMFIVFAITLVLGYLIFISPFHSLIREGVNKNNTPIVSKFYPKNYTGLYNNIISGKISSFEDDEGFYILDDDSQNYLVLYPVSKNESSFNQLKLNDNVIVHGHLIGKQIQAISVKIVNP